MISDWMFEQCVTLGHTVYGVKMGLGTNSLFISSSGQVFQLKDVDKMCEYFCRSCLYTLSYQSVVKNKYVCPDCGAMDWMPNS